MLNRVYVEAFNLEDNNKIDLIRRMMGLDDYETLSFGTEHLPSIIKDLGNPDKTVFVNK